MGRKGKLIAVIEGNKTEEIITVLKRLPKSLRDAVMEVTLDMSISMRKACESLFNNARQSPNAQIKLFRVNLRGDTDTKYFLFRLEKISA